MASPSLFLDTLLGTEPRAIFLDRHWSRAPFARTGGAESVADLVSPSQLALLLSDPALDLALVRDGEVAQRQRPTTLGQAKRALAEGVTLAFRHLERHAGALAALGRRLAAELHGSPNVHIYWTPAGHGSFGWHCDPEDVFLLQVRGEKSYRFRENTRHPFPHAGAMELRAAAHEEETPILSCTLGPGGWLYLPAGWWHDTLAESESLAVSVGLLGTTPIDLLDHLRAELLRDPRWRQRLPPLGHAVPLSDQEKLASWQEALARMGAELAERTSEPSLTLRYLRQLLLKGVQARRAVTDHAARPGQRP